MEPLAPLETSFINTCAEGARLVGAVGHRQFVLHLDVTAMSSEATPMTELIRQYIPRAGHVHANDPNMKGPGFGAVDFVPIFKAMRDAAYDRLVSVEAQLLVEGKISPETYEEWNRETGSKKLPDHVKPKKRATRKKAARPTRQAKRR